MCNFYNCILLCIWTNTNTNTNMNTNTNTNYTLCETIPDYIMGNKQITKHKVCIDIENK